MPISCSICTGSLEKNPPDDPTALPGAGALPCGHVFHQFCIEKWLRVSGPAGSPKLCPMCRKVVPGGKCLVIYPDVQEPTILEDSHSPTRCNHLIDIFSLQKQLAEANTQANKAGDLQALVEELQHSNDDLADELDGLEGQLASFNSLKAALNAVHTAGAYEDTYDWPVDEFSIQQLKNHKQLLVSDLRAAQKRESELRQELIATYKETNNSKAKLLKALNEGYTLKKDLTKAEMEMNVMEDQLARAKEARDYWKQECEQAEGKIKGLKKKVQDLEKTADEEPVVLYVKPLLKAKAAPARRGKNSTVPEALILNLPKPATTAQVTTKTNSGRKSYATRSKTRTQTK